MTGGWGGGSGIAVGGHEERVWWPLTGPAEVGPVCGHGTCLLTV